MHDQNPCTIYRFFFFFFFFNVPVLFLVIVCFISISHRLHPLVAYIVPFFYLAAFTRSFEDQTGEGAGVPPVVCCLLVLFPTGDKGAYILKKKHSKKKYIPKNIFKKKYPKLEENILKKKYIPRIRGKYNISIITDWSYVLLLTALHVYMSRRMYCMSFQLIPLMNQGGSPHR